MKRIFFFFCFVTLIGTAQAYTQTGPQAAFDLANTELENGNYNTALQQYKSIEQNGHISGALYLNMGIAATQVDSLGLAKYYLLKARQFDEVSMEAGRALEYVNSQFSRQSATLPKLPWDRAVDYLKSGPGAKGVFFTGIVFAFVALILLAGKWFSFIRFEKQAHIIAGSAILAALIVILAFYTDYVDRRYDEAVLVEQESRVLERPAADAPLVSMAYEGYSLTLDHRESEGHDGWYYVRLGNGQYGWIEAQGIKTL